VAFDGFRHCLDELGFRLFVEMSLFLGVSDAVSDDFIAARAYLLRDIRAVPVGGSIHLSLDGDIELVEEFEQSPDADTVALVPPGECAVGIGLFWRRDPGPLAFIVAELFDLDRDIDGKPFTAWPTVVRPLGNVRVGVPIMSTYHAGPPCNDR
jgi:hypothetical protein